MSLRAGFLQCMFLICGFCWKLELPGRSRIYRPLNPQFIGSSGNTVTLIMIKPLLKHHWMCVMNDFGGHWMRVDGYAWRRLIWMRRPGGRGEVRCWHSNFSWPAEWHLVAAIYHCPWCHLPLASCRAPFSSGDFLVSISSFWFLWTCQCSSSFSFSAWLCSFLLLFAPWRIPVPYFRELFSHKIIEERSPLVHTWRSRGSSAHSALYWLKREVWCHECKHNMNECLSTPKGYYLLSDVHTILWS